MKVKRTLYLQVSVRVTSQTVVKKSKFTYTNLFDGSSNVLVINTFHQFQYDPQIFVLIRVEVSALHIVTIEFEM